MQKRKVFSQAMEKHCIAIIFFFHFIASIIYFLIITIEFSKVSLFPDEKHYQIEITNNELFYQEFELTKLLTYLIYSPFHLAQYFGLDGLLALRINGFIYSSAFLILMFNISRKAERIRNSYYLLLFILLFVPTFYIFRISGLLEPIIMFFQTLIIYGLFQIDSRRNLLLGTHSILLSILVLLNIKFYLGLVSGLILILISIIRIIENLRKKRIVPKELLQNFRVNRKHVFVILLYFSLSAGMLWESSIKVADILQKDTGEKRYVQEGNSVANGLIAWQTSRYLLDQIPLEKGSAGNIILKLASKDQDCIREVSRIRGKCESQVSQFSINPPDNIYIAVLHIPSLMSIPNPFYKQGSIFLQIISIETIFWIFLLSVTCVNLLKIRKKIVNSNLLMYSMLFILIFMLGSAYLEINVGTWVRHRTLLLAPSLSIIATAKRIMPLQLISGLKIKL